MKRLMLVAALAAGMMNAQWMMVPTGPSGKKEPIAVASVVYVTNHGKTWHTDRNCMALARSAGVLQTTVALATAHGMTECAICQHRHAAVGASGRKTFDNSWAAYPAKTGDGK